MRKRAPVYLGIFLVCIAIWLLTTSSSSVHFFMDRLENIGYDIQLRTYVFTRDIAPSSSVAIIDIDDKSLQAEGRWPWSRNKVAELVDEIVKEGAAVVAFDILFSESESNIADVLVERLNKNNLLNASLAEVLKKSAPLFDNDAILAKSLNQNPVVLALGFLPRKQTENALPAPSLVLNLQEQSQLNIIKSEGFISNLPIIQQASKGSGFINIFDDSDGIIRRAPLLMEYQDGIYPSLALQAVLSFLGENIHLITPIYHKEMKLEGIKLGNVTIPTDSQGQVLIPFIGRSYTFPYYSATDVLHHKLPKDALLGKILFLGTSATGLGDLQSTAIQSPFPGVEIQATLANGLLDHHFSYKPAWTFGANLILTILFGLISAFLFPHLGPRSLSFVVLVVPLSILLINDMIWVSTGLILSSLVPSLLILSIAILNLIYGYLFESRRREHLREMFGQYVPEKHIDEMLKSSDHYGLSGDDREMSVLFADIRNFTTISEGMSATELVEMLNQYFTPMTEIIFQNNGTIDKYVGDLVMAFWGAPLIDKNHASDAMKSALAMQNRLNELRPIFKERNWPELRVGIGINTGSMSVGDMGSKFRRNYTVLGDAVNLASRVESLSKYYGVDIVVTENTEKNHPEFLFRRLDRVRVKGKMTGVNIFELIGQASEITHELENELRIYNIALEAYFAQKWDEAYGYMTTLAKRYEEKKIYSMYLERINEFKQNPPPSDWDGVYVHKSK